MGNNLIKATSGLAEEAKSNERYKSSHTKLMQDLDTYIVNPSVGEELRRRIHKRMRELQEGGAQRRL